jgi:hypothetical protein
MLERGLGVGDAADPGAGVRAARIDDDKVAATSAGTSETTKATSRSRPGLIPQATPAARNPSADVTPPALMSFASMTWRG